MNLLIEFLNRSAEQALSVAWPAFWQSSALIAVLLVLDLGLRRRLRAAVRYVLWLTVLVKLLLPPSFALPSGIGWWLRPALPPLADHKPATALVLTYEPTRVPSLPMQNLPTPPDRTPIHISRSAWVLVVSGCTSCGLLLWMLGQWWRVWRETQRAAAAPERLRELLGEVCHSAELRRTVRLRLIVNSVSPAVCGLFRPIILLPHTLVEQLNLSQLRAVLLHETIHLQRGDLWINCLQALLQIIYWWHPLVWLANTRIRQSREEAVDDAVMLALRQDSGLYAPTLIQVARLVLQRPLASLGLVGILESQNSLRWRIERLIDFHPPRTAGLTLVSALGLLGFGALALPMGRAPAIPPKPETSSAVVSPVPTAPVDTRALKFDWYLGNLLLQQGTLGAPAGIALASNGVSSAKPPGPFATTDTALSTDQIPRSVLPEPQLVLTNDDQAGASARARKSKLAILLEQAKQLFKIRKLDASEQTLMAILKLDRTNQAAYYYLNLIAETRYRISQKNDAPPSELQFIPNFIPTNSTESTARLTTILRKLRTVRFDHIQFDNLPLGEVIRYLNDQAQERDLAKVGLHFSRQPVSNHLEAGLGEADQSDLSAVRIKILPALIDVRLGDVLDAIVKVADKPIQYAVRDDGVVFEWKTDQPRPLYTRTIKVDPDIFGQRLERLFGIASPRPGAPRNKQELARAFFGSMGVNLDPPKSLDFNEREGTLLIHATLQDLDQIEAAVQLLNTESPQINLKVEFFEVPEEFAEPVWNLLETTNHLADKRSSLAAGLTSQQWSVFRQALRSNNEVRFLNQASVTTLNGRPFEIQVVDLKTIATNLNPQALRPPGVSTTTPGGGIYLEGQIPFGPQLDAVAIALPSGDTWQIELNATASMTDLSYYERTNQVRVYIDGKRKSVPFALPHFRTRKVTANAIVLDAQTLVIGTRRDEPLEGYDRLGEKRKRLLAVITPTIIDSAGNRLQARGK